jgi:NADH-quinone oxidoreductase subunit N
MPTLDTLREIAATNQWVAIYPEMFLGLLALALLVLEIALPKERHGLIPRVAIVGQALLFIWVFLDWNNPLLGRSDLFAGMLAFSPLGQAWRLFFLLASILVCYLGMVALQRQQLPRIEFFHITLVVTGAMMLLAQSNHFVMLFVALETVTIGLYVLVAYFRDNALSLEAGLKFLVMGALSSALLLFGIVLLYGVASSPGLVNRTIEPMNFDALAPFLAANASHPIAIAGMLLVLSGICFKIGAVPFQIWIPDVYQGAPTPVTAFLAVASKAVGFAVLLTLVTKVFAPMPALVPLLAVVAAASILFGNLAAVAQRNTKRLMGLSGISHAGYLLLGVLAALTIPWAAGAVYFYLLTYLLASMAVFGVIAHVGAPDDASQELAHYADLSREKPFLAAVLAVGLGSLAGIPPLAGFVGKLLLFVAAFQAGHFVLLTIAVVGVVISIYYYFGWMKAAFFETWRLPASEAAPAVQVVPGPALTIPGRLTLASLALASVVLGFFQGPLGDWLATRF